MINIIKKLIAYFTWQMWPTGMCKESLLMWEKLNQPPEGQFVFRPVCV